MNIKERFDSDKECTIQYYVSELLHLDLSDYLKKQLQKWHNNEVNSFVSSFPINRKSEIWGLTCDHVQISVTDKRGDLNLTFYYSEIFYSIKNDSLILYAPMGTMADSSHYNKDKVKIVDLQNASEIYDMSTNHKKLGIERFSAYYK